MKNISLVLLSVFCAVLTAGSAEQLPERQTYPLSAEAVKANAAKVEKDTMSAPDAWKKAPLAYYAVPAMSDIKRLSDIYPSDGTPFGELEAIAAKGEYEPVSFMIYPKADFNKFELKASDLKSASGAVIPASAVDLKLVKIWYQAGSSWYGYFADALGRKLTPELLLNDETLVISDPNTKDNYIRYSNADGSSKYVWMSANFMDVNYTFANQANTALIKDADALRPVVLNKNEFKQFFATVGVPKNAADGIYTGKIEMTADGKSIGSIPVRLRVLPFELPAPKTNYNLEKGFYLCLYGTKSRNPNVIRNLAKHNALNPMGFPSINTFTPEELENDIKLANECGVSTRPLFSGTEDVGIAVKDDPPKGEDRRKLEILRKVISETAELSKKHLGHTDFYSYGIDEGGPDKIRAQRAAWHIAHDAGGKVMVTSYAHRKLLFALDFLIIPGMPVEKREYEVNKFHEANPDALTGWYANPHSGPENPDYFRRIHGIMAYKANYDVSSNYCWWRNNWNDFATPYENNLRGLIMVYATADNIIDTLAWEGVREGLDDVRYATKLKQLATQALKSKNGDTLLLGRRAMSFLTYADEKRDDMDSLRLECINYIIQLDNALKGGK